MAHDERASGCLEGSGSRRRGTRGYDHTLSPERLGGGGDCGAHPRSGGRWRREEKEGEEKMISAGLKASAAAIAVMLGAWIWVAFALPEDATRVPVHWGVSGAPDDFVAREHALAYFGALPGTGLLLAILFWAIPRLEPLRENLLKGSRAYLAGWIGAQAMFALIALGMAFAWT